MRQNVTRVLRYATHRLQAFVLTRLSALLLAVANVLSRVNLLKAAAALIRISGACHRRNSHKMLEYIDSVSARLEQLPPLGKHQEHLASMIAELGQARTFTIASTELLGSHEARALFVLESARRRARPGELLHRVLAFLCTKKVMTRRFEPIIASMQHEWLEARDSGAGQWALLKIRLSGLWDIAEAANVGTLWTILDTVIHALQWVISQCDKK